MKRAKLSVDKEFTWRKLLFPGLAAANFWTLALVLYSVTGERFPLVNFGYLGTALGIGTGLYAILPRREKPLGRRVSLLMIGLYLFIFVGLIGRENIQIEGIWWSLLNGTFYAAIWHYVVAKLVGPLLFGRLWCGWACWSVMVFDLLPYKRPPRSPAKTLGLAALWAPHCKHYIDIGDSSTAWHTDWYQLWTCRYLVPGWQCTLLCNWYWACNNTQR